MHSVDILLALAVQELSTPPGIANNAELWPYLVGIAALASVVVGMAGYIVEQFSTIRTCTEDHAKHIAEIYKAQRAADEEKSKRIADEFAKKDAQLLDVVITATKQTGEYQKRSAA